MSLAIIGATLLIFCLIAYVFNFAVMSDQFFLSAEDFQARKDLYREKRDRFRNSPKAIAELRQWKACNADYNYQELAPGLIPKAMVGKFIGSRPFAKCDTWFSEFEEHNDESLILDASPRSYIIGNKSSHDSRQYPQWFNPNYKPGENTPEGQAFGHTLVVSRKRIFNVVDPEATANDCALLKEMKGHFVNFWEHEGCSKLIKRVKRAFDEQNRNLEKNEQTLNSYRELQPVINADFDTLSDIFRKLKPEDFEYAFHPHPENSIGHLHMHIFPKSGSLRKFSTKAHDWKTIPLEAISEVEQEDREKANTSGG